MSFCMNCGTRLVEDANYCHNCGMPIGKLKNTSEDKTDILKRQQEYVGKVFKCPNCGNVVNPSDVICSSCGFYLSGKEAVSSAKDFQIQIIDIEKTRKKQGIWDDPNRLSETDKQILSLIRNFPIPNTIEDIVEFIHMAIANIDVGISKRSFGNKMSDHLPAHQISNAWVAKLQQLYKKAELYFSNEPEFTHIKELYQEKMRELNIKV